jgi:hypothetical protein
VKHMTAKDFRHRPDVIDGWEVRVTSYVIAGTWCCRVDDVSPGGTVARARAPTREQAEAEGIERARQRMRTTRLFGQ